MGRNGLLGRLVVITAKFAARSSIADGTSETYDRFIGQFNASAFIGARTRIAIAVSFFKGVAIVATSASFTIVTGRVVLTDTSSALSLANVSESVAVAGNAAGEWSTIGRFVTESRSARLAKLSNVAIGTVTTYDPIGRSSTCTSAGSFQFDVIKVSGRSGTVRAADFEGLRLSC